MIGVLSSPRLRTLVACTLLGVLAPFLLDGGWASAQAEAPDAPPAVAVYSIESQKLEVRWSTSDAASTTSFKIQWKSGSEEFDSSRQLSSDPATSIEIDQSTSAGDRYVDTLTGLTDGAEYTVRVIATNANGDSDPSATATGTPASQPGQAREFWENEVVTIFESSSPWLRETWDYITTQNVPVFWTPGPSGAAFILCSSVIPSELRECDADEVHISRFYINLIYGIAHELAHVYTLANRVTATPGPLGIARLYFHVLASQGSLAEPSCAPIEIFADAAGILTIGDQYQSSGSYWAGCPITKDTVSEQALAVVRSAQSGQMPSWLADNYNDSDGNPDLARVWRDVKAIENDTNGRGFRAAVVFQLRDAFGGYCDNHKATDSAFGSGITRNPWQDGGCVPEAPANVSVTAAGSGKLTVSWEEPLYDGGSTIEGFRIQWKSGTQEYHASRQATVTDLSDLQHTISGLTNDESHSIRVLAYNHNGDGAAAETTATPTATDTTEPELLRAWFDGGVRLAYNEALDESSLPPSTAFTVTVNGVSRGGNVSIEDNVVTIGVSGITSAIDSLKVSYTAPTGSGAMPLKDSGGNKAADFSNQSVRNDRIQVAITSNPGSDNTYSYNSGYGKQDSIEVTVTFGEPVIVNGLPEIQLEIGSNTRRAAYHSGSGTSSLVFRYPVIPRDTDSDGIFVRSSGRELSKLTGPGLVRYASTKATAPARLERSLQSDHLVDGVRPTLVSADIVAGGTDLALRWDKALDEDSATGSSLFQVENTSDNSFLGITAVSIQGQVVTLTLSSAISATDQLTVSYYDPFGHVPEDSLMEINYKPLKDTVGNAPVKINALVTITDPPPQVSVSFEATSYQAEEGGASATVTVVLDQDPLRTLTIPLTATPRGGATPGDYTAPTEVVFNAGETSKNVTVTAVDDSTDDDGESVELTFGRLPDGVSEGATTQTAVRIVDDDDRVLPPPPPPPPPRTGGGGGGGGGAPANQAPEFTEGDRTTRSVAENTPAGADIGEPVAATDFNRDTLTYSLRGLGSDLFNIDSSSGQLLTKAALDYETEASYTVFVWVQDNKNAIGRPDTQRDTVIRVAITVTNEDEPGTVTLSLSEPDVDVALTASLTDLDGGLDRVVWSWARSTDQTAWTAISGAALASYTPVAADKGSYLRATASYTDAQGPRKSADAATAAPVPSNTPPEFPGVQDGGLERSVAENTGEGEAVGAPVAATDAEDDALTYALGGADADIFTIDETTGQIRVGAGTTLDYEADKNVYEVTVTATDSSGLSATVAVTIAVTNVGLGSPSGDAYDADGNEAIDRDEAITALADYFSGGMTREEAIAVLQLYFAR